MTIDNASHEPKREDLIALDVHELHTLPDNQVLFRGYSTQKSAVIEQTAVTLLPYLQKFRTVDKHVVAIIERFPELKQSSGDLKALIKALQRANVMVSAKKTLDKIVRPTEASAPSERVNIFIITCDRPNTLNRLIESCPMLDQGVFSWTLIDDSRNKKNAQANREIANSSRIPIRYFGPAEQDAFRLKLSNHIPHAKNAIDFLLCGDSNDIRATYGRSRNFAMLLSPMERLIVMDDDIVCHTYNPPHIKNGARFSSTSRDADFFTSNSDWEHTRRNNTNPILEHVKYLGFSIPEVLRSCENDPLNELSPLHDSSFSDVFLIQNSSKIMCTLNGTYGDPGTASIDWIFSLNQASTKRLLKSIDKFSTGLPKRNCWLGRNAPTILNKFSMMSQVTGLDHTISMPPYYPNGRNEDFLFGEMLQYLYPHKAALDLPLATPHLPIPERTWDSALFSKPMNPGMNHFLAATISQIAFEKITAQTADLGMERLALHFLQIGEMDRESLSALICNHIANTRTAYLEGIHNKCKSNNFTAQSNIIINQIRKANSNNLSNITANHMTDLVSNTHSTDTINFIKQSCNKYGNAMRFWSEIVHQSQCI